MAGVFQNVFGGAASSGAVKSDDGKSLVLSVGWRRSRDSYLVKQLRWDRDYNCISIAFPTLSTSMVTNPYV